jgi:hypothetical protein
LGCHHHPLPLPQQPELRSLSYYALRGWGWGVARQLRPRALLRQLVQALLKWAIEGVFLAA